MPLQKEYNRKVLKSIHKASYRIKEAKTTLLKFKRMNKKSFIEIIRALKEIDDRRDFMEAEIGVDMTQYEDKFFNIIEGLFKIIFNKSQLALIQMYLYQLVPDKEWDGKITVEINNTEKEVEFKTAAQVWDVIKKFED